MKSTSLNTLFLLFILACGGEAGPAEEQHEEAGEAMAEIDTDKIWKMRCVACHGLYGDMEMNGAANLQKVTSSLESRVEIITNGKGVMTPWKGILTEEEILAMAKHTMTLNPDL